MFLPLTGTAIVDGELPPLHDILAASPSQPPIASRVVPLLQVFASCTFATCPFESETTVL